MTDRRPISFTYMEGAQDHKITKDYDDNLYYDDNKKIIHVESTSNSESQELKSFYIKYIEDTTILHYTFDTIISKVFSFI